MEKYLNKGIKEIISNFPKVAEILDEYNIGCAPCSVGTCLLKDIVEIHNLPLEEELVLMARIAKVIYPDREVKIPQIKRKPKAKEIKYSPPMRKLVDEHVLIMRWVALIPEVVKDIEIESEEGRQLINDGVDFIRSYADKYHHAKEEDVLFKYFDENLDILKAMHEDHEKARSHVKAVLKAMDERDKKAVAEHLSAYGEILAGHIKKEDEILYPWMDRNLSTTQIGELFSKFSVIDERFRSVSEKYEKFIGKLEEKFKLKGVLK